MQNLKALLVVLTGIAVALMGAPDRHPLEGVWVRQVFTPAVVPSSKGCYLGNSDYRRKPGSPQRSEGARLSAGVVDGLAQVTGSSLRFRFRLGSDPYFRFTPIVPDGAGQDYRFRVLVDDGQGVQEIYQAEVSPIRRFAPSAVQVSLQAWGGESVDLVLTVSSPAPGQVIWGSPEIWGRYRRWRIAPTARPNILLIGADTLRADALELDPSRPSLTPALLRFATEADRWDNAYTSFNVTNPSFASLFSGLWGQGHGIYQFGTSLPPEVSALPDLLGRRGYRSFAAFSAPHLGPLMASRFDESLVSTDQIAAEWVVEATMDFVDRTQQPFFAFVHLFDAHIPHYAPEPYSLGQFASAVGLASEVPYANYRSEGLRPFKHPWLAADRDHYQSEVAYLDRQVGRLLDFVDSRGLLENTLVIFVADHGENLEDHGIDNGHEGLWETTTHVPLIIRWPGQTTGRRHPGLVQHFDIFPTILRAAGVTPPANDGIDVTPNAQGQSASRRVVFAETIKHRGSMIRTEDWKYFRMEPESGGPPQPFLYDLSVDPQEANNLSGLDREIEALLRGKLQDWLMGPSRSNGEITLGEEERKRLQALGYMDP